MAEQRDIPADPGPAAPGRGAGDACPFLVLAGDPAARFDFPSSEHRCRATAPVYVELAHQGTYCLTGRHIECPRYTGPDAVAAPPAAAPVRPGAPAAPGPAGDEPPAGTPPDPAGPRATYALAARGGFGALASTPRGWVPVETAAPVPPQPSAADEPPSEVPGTSPGGTLGLWTTAAAAEETAAPAAETAAAETADADAEGIGALVGGTAGPPDGPTPGGDAGAIPEGSVAIVAAVAEPAVAPGDDAPGRGATEAGEVVGAAALEGAGGGRRSTARLADAARHVVRALAILAAVILVLAALVGVGYVAGRVLVRPGEALPAAARTPAVTVAPSAPGAGPTALPGAGAATAPPAGSVAPTTPAPAASTPAPTSTAEPTPKPTPKPRVYVVRSGDTLFAISQRFGVSVQAIMEANDIADPNLIVPGQRLTIPRP